MCLKHRSWGFLACLSQRNPKESNVVKWVSMKPDAVTPFGEKSGRSVSW